MDKTIGQTLDELRALKTKEDANEYLAKLVITGQTHTWSGIKYVVGYLGNDERQRIMDLFPKGAK